MALTSSLIVAPVPPIPGSLDENRQPIPRRLHGGPRRRQSAAAVKCGGGEVP